MNKIYQKTFPGGQNPANPQSGAPIQAVIAGMDRQSRNEKDLDEQTGSRVRARDDKQRQKGFTLTEPLTNRCHCEGSGGPQGSGISALIYHKVSRFLSCGPVFINNRKAGDPRQKHSGMTVLKPFRMTALFNKGFTLIELLVVVLIIGILAAVALPQYQKAVIRARMMQNIMRLSAITQSGKLYKLANGQWPEDVRDLDIDVAADAVRFDKGNWTQSQNNISAYYKDGSNCGPGATGGGACADKNFFLYTSPDPDRMFCRGYTPATQDICRSLAGGAEPVAPAQGLQGATYQIRF